MTRREYDRMTLAEMKKRRWKTTRTVGTQVKAIEAGREVRITAKRGGLSLETDVCPSCGVRFTARRCSPYDVEEIT